MEVTAHNKDGVVMVDQFEKIIDRVKAEYGCKVVYLTTDADGGSKKGCKILCSIGHGCGLQIDGLTSHSLSLVTTSRCMAQLVILLNW